MLIDVVKATEMIEDFLLRFHLHNVQGLTIVDRMQTNPPARWCSPDLIKAVKELLGCARFRPRRNRTSSVLGRLGKVANCQAGVFVVYASARGYIFVDGCLYLPEYWFEDDYGERWQRCGIPDEVIFHTKPELALAMIRELVMRNMPPFRWVTGDEHFGQNPAFWTGFRRWASGIWSKCQ